MIASCASASQLDSDQTSGNSVHKRPRVLLAITGSVAAIKGPELAIRIAEEFHADVKILLTRGGQNFWDKAEAYNPHYWRKMQEMLLDGKNNDSIAAIHYADDEWKAWQKMGDPVLHIDLRDWADLLVVAPLSAHTMAKMSQGLCDDTLTCIVRAWDFGHGKRPGKPMLLAPAMNTAMWDHPLTQLQLKTIQGFWNANRVTAVNGEASTSREGVLIVAPQVKVLACGEVGDGALAPVESIIRTVGKLLVTTR